MKKKYFSALSVLVFLLVFSTLVPVVVNGWANPLATDPTDDPGIEAIGEDILSVDAQLANKFVYFRFKMNDPLITLMNYYVIVDFDKNLSTGEFFTDSDIGYDAFVDCGIPDESFIGVRIELSVYGGSMHYVEYNMTANNGSVVSWSNPSIIPYFDLLIFTNGSQGDIAFGVNWSWFCSQIALEGVIGDGVSMYLEFFAGWDTDWCPDRTGGATDYIEWIFEEDTGIPGFSAVLVIFSLLSVLLVMVLLDRQRIKF